MSLLQRLPKSTSWLVSQSKDRVLLFIKKPKYNKSFPIVTTQLWHCTTQGITTRLKNTRRIDFDSALETWTKLIINGWELVKHQINENAALLSDFEFIHQTD